MPIKTFCFAFTSLFLSLCLSSCDVPTSTEKATKEGMLIIGNNAEPQSFDPHLATSVSDGKIIRSLLEGLLRGDAADDSQVLPGVASHWKSNERADEWTFHLNPKAQWSDGKALTADDFVYAYKRLLHPEFGGRYAEMLYPLLGAEDYNKGKITADQLGVSAPDPHTLKLKLHSPTPQLPILLLHYAWFPIPAHKIEQYGGMLDRRGDWIRPQNWVGNGAFLLTQYRFNDFVEVKKNPHYLRADDVKLNAIRFLPTVNGFTETRMFFDGKLHISNNVPPEMIAFAKKKGGDQYKQDPYYATIFYRINTQRKPLNDVRVRLALSLSLDRDALVRDIARGAGAPATGFTPPGANYHPPQSVHTDIQKAQTLLAEAGYPEGKGFPKITIMTTSREVQKTTAEAIQAMWLNNLGIEVEIESREWTAYKVAQNSGNYDLSSSSWSGDYLDAASFVGMWQTNGGNNNTGWGNAECDASLQAAQNAGNIQDRTALLEKAERTMLEESPILPLYWSHRTYLMSPEVVGWKPLLLDNHPLEAISLKPQAKEDRHD